MNGFQLIVGLIILGGIGWVLGPYVSGLGFALTVLAVGLLGSALGAFDDRTGHGP